MPWIESRRRVVFQRAARADSAEAAGQGRAWGPVHWLPNDSFEIEAVQQVENTASPSASRPSRVNATANVAIFIGVAAAMLVAFVAFSRQSTQDLPVRSFASTVPQQPDPIAEPIEAPAADQPPVRFTNPFDKTEVFEFPAGTTRAAARDAVAEILRERAQERLVQDTRTTHRR